MIQVNEVDLTNVVPIFFEQLVLVLMTFLKKGPVSSIVNISSEEELVEIFDKPKTTGNQFETFFSVSNFFKIYRFIKGR